MRLAAAAAAARIARAEMYARGDLTHAVRCFLCGTADPPAAARRGPARPGSQDVSNPIQHYAPNRTHLRFRAHTAAADIM